eukprot:Phypoly_transcript_04309.p1 GENE.Phypoly_transcript_04309~~Phypoly_transcript_04309.p1  ORF type:complete len:715 (+),score=105.32 Phypoly_transcript_04309:82-2145(+)
MASIHFLRPELCYGGWDPIPLNPPHNFFKVFSAPDIGDLMLASFMPHDVKVSHLVSPTKPWWLGEKYDGIRCLWNPIKRKLFTRRANKLPLLPAHFAQFNDVTIFLDGELWCGRGNFSETQITYTNPNADWSIPRLLTFDDPSPGNHLDPFEQRYKNVIDVVQNENPFIILAMRVSCTTKKLLAIFAQQIIADHGEGVILRKPASVYEKGRSGALIKIKSARADAEAIVVNVGAEVTLKLPNGILFSVDSANYKSMQLKRGEIVTFDYVNITKSGKPVNPVISRIRTDTDWKTVVHDFLRDEQELRSSDKPQKHWTAAQKAHLRALLEDVVRRQNLDPTKPSTWYSFAQIFGNQKDKLPVVLFEGSYVKNLQKLFPELGLDEKKFGSRYRGFWAAVHNRKAFFDSFAASIGFDPKIAENWYKVTKQQIEEFSGLGSILHYYQESFSNAIFHVYPNIGVRKEKFTIYHVGHWDEYENRKKFFDDFAKDHGFDPSIPENWYKINAHQINSRKDSDMLLRRYHNFTDAIAEAYPNIRFDLNKFDVIPRNHWHSKSNRKAFFEAFAKAKSFDPLSATDWYKVVPSDIRAFKGGIAVLDYYDKNLAKALNHLYPTLHLEEKRFAAPYGHWAEETHRREFFENFAQEFGFDPKIAQNWRNISKSSLQNREGFKSVIRHHGNNYKKALHKLFNI